jgi:hypothetical protein
MMQSHTNISYSQSASRGMNGGFASLLHPRKSIISDKSSVISTGLFNQRFGGIVSLQPSNLAIVVKPSYWETCSEVVFDGV